MSFAAVLLSACGGRPSAIDVVGGIAVEAQAERDACLAELATRPAAACAEVVRVIQSGEMACPPGTTAEVTSSQADGGALTHPTAKFAVRCRCPAPDEGR